MTENEIAEYLRAHPEFIAKHIDLLNAHHNAEKAEFPFAKLSLYQTDKFHSYSKKFVL